MASTLSLVRKAVRLNIGDTAKGTYAIHTPTMNEIIQRKCRLLSGRMALGEAWETGAVTITSGSENAALSTSYGYQRVKELRRSDGYVLKKLTPEEMTARYWNDGTVTEHGTADPEYYAIWEDQTTNTVRLRFDYPVKTTGTLDLLRSVLPDDLTSDATVIPFADYAYEALVLLVSAECLTRMTDKQLEDRGLSRGISDSWRAEAEVFIRAESDRIQSLKSTGRMQRNIV